MPVFHHESSVTVPRPRPEVFAFFSDAGNLERLTPPWLSFEVLTPQPVDMREGRLIDYRLRIRGVPVAGAPASPPGSRRGTSPTSSSRAPTGAGSTSTTSRRPTAAPPPRCATG